VRWVDNMLPRFLASLAAASLFRGVQAQHTTFTYNIHGAVVIALSGERTPLVSDTVKLTSTGAQQMYQNVRNFRS